MPVHQAVIAGLTGNEISKQITGTDEVSAARTTVAVGAGALTGAAVSGAVAIGGAAIGLASAPVTVPLAVVSGLVAGIASLFD